MHTWRTLTVTPRTVPLSDFQPFTKIPIVIYYGDNIPEPRRVSRDDTAGLTAGTTHGNPDRRPAGCRTPHARIERSIAMAEERRNELGRREFLGAAGSLAAMSLLGGSQSAQARGSGSSTAAQSSGRRKLGKLEVSSVGLGVQNMSRTYQTTVPYRPEMLNIIRTAFDRGVTFFDAAEAYGPHEVERILGEGVAPFRDKVAITSKFGSTSISRRARSAAG